ncbi:MAG: hypothetical protein OEY80_13695 [Nitrospirota bacterium]|nr:hypothetical protein [Nitrospirota bacterium]MDH4359241.1 hypothetical protein [Nitrospirota bacterium]MDH5576534.1 hypothetical protein [Nitrospirota bacterium]
MELGPVTILACAGRRIDASDASISRFPLIESDRVGREVEAVLRTQRVTLVVSSAACGADLIVLHVAHRLGIRTLVVLPFSPELFRRHSVMDRPSSAAWDWGKLYDQMIEKVRKAGDLKILKGTPESHLGYQAVNRALVAEAMALGKQESARGRESSGIGLAQVKALIIWDGESRGPQDLTMHFSEEACAQGLPVLEIFTLASS